MALCILKEYLFSRISGEVDTSVIIVMVSFIWGFTDYEWSHFRNWIVRKCVFTFYLQQWSCVLLCVIMKHRKRDCCFTKNTKGGYFVASCLQASNVTGKEVDFQQKVIVLKYLKPCENKIINLHCSLLIVSSMHCHYQTDHFNCDSHNTYFII